MSARLVGRGTQEARIDAAVGDRATIGASQSNDIVVPVEGVSRAHARIFREGDHYVIEDVGSRNGTWVNGDRIRRVRLAHLDVVTIGLIELVFVDTAAPGAAEYLVKGSQAQDALAATSTQTADISDQEWLAAAREAASARSDRPARSASNGDTPRMGSSPIPALLRNANLKTPTPRAPTVLGFRDVGPPTGPLTEAATRPDSGRGVAERETSFTNAPTVPAYSQDATQPPITGITLTGDLGEFELGRGRWTIGRAADASVHIDSREVSRLHAAIMISAHMVVVEDCGSSNGTAVNGEVIADPRLLMDGDRVAFGNFEFRVEFVLEDRRR